MPWLDLFVLACVAVGSLVVGTLIWRRGGPGRRAGSLAAAVYGVLLSATMSAHTLDILVRWFIGRRYDGRPLAYDFHLYSLILLGLLLTGCGIALLRASWRAAGGEQAGRSQALRATGAALLIVAPLLPIQPFFAVPLTVLGGLVALVVRFTGRRSDALRRLH